MPSKRSGTSGRRGKAASRAREKRYIFVIMPFTATPTRTERDLTEFFQTNLKARIESERSFSYQYVVSRSSDTFDITERIIRDLYAADIVLCDLSGEAANPNVMYELGVRLGITNKPVILFRESAAWNRRIFDIQGFYAYEYSATRYRELEDHVIAKIRKFEAGDELYQSPVLKVLNYEPSIVRELKRARAASILYMVTVGLATLHAMTELIIDEFVNASVDGEPTDSDTTNALFNDIPRFKGLEWARLPLRPQLFPAIETFLSEPLLEEFLSDSQHKRVFDFAAVYYARYFAVPSIWNTPTFENVLGFLGHTESLRSTVKHLRMYLRLTDDAARRWHLDRAVGIVNDFMDPKAPFRRHQYTDSAKDKPA